MIPIVYSLVPTIVGTAMLVGLNSSGKKGALLFGNQLHIRCSTQCSHKRLLATYIIGTFGSALSTVYAYNASNTSGHTKKVH